MDEASGELRQAQAHQQPARRQRTCELYNTFVIKQEQKKS